MENKLSKILPVYFLVAGLTALAVSKYLLSIPGGTTNQVILGVSARYFFIVVMSLVLLLAGCVLSALAYYSWRKPSRVLDWIESLLSREVWSRRIFLTSAFILLTGFWINISPAQLPISLVIFIRIQPVLIWAMFVAALTILCLTTLLPAQFRYIAAELVAFILNVIFIRTVQMFLFPLESYWLPIAAGLFFYMLTDAVLVQIGWMKNLFSALDQEKVEIEEAFWFIAGPLVLALVIMIGGGGHLFFLLPVLCFVCGLQIFLTSILAGILEWIWLPKKSASLIRGLLWVGSIALVLWFYYLALIQLNTYTRYYPGLLPLSTYPHYNPLLKGDPLIQGVWYTIPVEKSQLYPLGYARLEDSVIDDMGHPFLAVLGSTMGFIQPCNSPFPNIANAVQMPGTSSVQPSFETTFYMLCPEWEKTLPEFYWRIGMLGILLTAMVFGMVILRDPIAFFVTALVLLKAWISWPASSTIRPGQVEFLLFGLPFVMLLPYIIRYAKYSTILAWCLFCGMIAGFSGFVRQPAGLAILAAGGLAIVLFAGFKHRRLLLVVTMLFAFLAGTQIVPTTVRGLLWYRDIRLQIAAPRISIASHGSGWNPLGGIGGAYVGKILYPNALDMTHWDPILMLNGYNENPLLEFAINKLSPGMSISTDLFVGYVLHHPLQFAMITSQKTYQAWNLMIDIPVNWLQVSLTLGILGSLGILLKQSLTSLDPSRFDNNIRYDVTDALLTCLALGAIAALPAIITDPGYSQSIYPATAVLFITILMALYYGIFHRTFFSQGE